MCKVCTLEKENNEFPKGKHTCNECFHLLRCYICDGVFEKKNCRNRSRCNRCDNALHDANKKKNPTPAYLAKLQRATDTRREKGYSYSEAKLSDEAKSIKKLRKSVRDLFKSWQIYKTQKAFNYLNFTKEEFILKFPIIGRGMHLDHKIPVTWFVLGSPVGVIYDLDNLQLLSARDNISKGNRYCHPVSQSYYDLALPHIKPEYVNKLLIEDIPENK